MFGVDDDILVLFDDIDDVQLDAQLFRNPERIVALFPFAVAVAYRMGVAFDAKAGKKN